MSTLAGENGRLLLLGVESGSSQVIAKGATFATWSPDGSSLYYFTKAGATTRARWRFEEGHLDTGDVVRDRFIGKGDAYLYGYSGPAPGHARSPSPATDTT